MAKYIGWRDREPQAVLEDRVHRLEVRVTALTEALRALARGLEDLPTAEPANGRLTAAARHAHDLLLAADPPSAKRAD